jgi:DNA-directed RNA polymerase subunit RPC12/RpoP
MSRCGLSDWEHYSAELCLCFLYLPCWGAWQQQFMFYVNWYFAETMSWHELHPPRNSNLERVSVGDPRELALQVVVCQSGEIQHQDQEITFSVLSSATINKGSYVPHFHQSTQGFKCRNCGKSYRWKTSMYNHLRLECGKEPQLQCPHCPYRAKLNWNLQKHIRSKHWTQGILYGMCNFYCFQYQELLVCNTVC